MDDPGMGERLVDALVSGFPDSKRDLRPVHTFGVGATGYFVASDVARDFCVAEHFQGKQVPVTVRFSNGSGSSVQHDGCSDIRGMATRFHLADGVATDLIAMTLGEFFTPTVETFLSFSEATKPIPYRRESAWQKIFDMLRLIQPPLPDPCPGQPTSPIPGAVQFADRHGYAQFPVFQGLFLGAPKSYARASYHAVHTFVVLAPAAGFASLGNPSPGFSTPIPRRRRSINICNRNCATASRERPRASF
jgi:catalase